MERYNRLSETHGLALLRQGQQVKWMWSMVEDRLVSKLRNHPKIKAMVPAIEGEVVDGKLTPALAVERLFKAFGI